MDIGPGFGFYRNKDKKLIRKKSNFGITIENDVDTGENTTIEPGSWRNTVIGEGTKIDNLVLVGHNAIIGKHCVIVGGTVLGGSTEIGDYTYLGLNTTVKHHIKIGKHCIIGAGSVVIKDIPDNSIIAGNPAKPIKCNLTPKELFQMAGIGKYVEE